MRLALIAALCLACAAKHPPKPDSLKSGIDLVERAIISALRACDKLPAKPPNKATRRGARMRLESPPEGWHAFGAADDETFEMELLYNKRDFHAKVQRVAGQPWVVLGDITPDPCGDETLAVAEDDVDAINAQDLPWKAALIPANTGKTARDMGIRIDPKRRIPVTGGGYLTVRRGLDPLAPIVVGGIALPESYDARDRYAGEYPCQAFAVRTQNPCSSCSHFSTSSAFGARLCLQNGRTSATNVLVSPRQISDCAQSPSGCAPDGSGNARGNLDWYGASPPRAKEEWCLPFQTQPDTCDTAGCPLSRSFSVKDPQKRSGSAPVMQAELLQNGPLIVSFLVENGFFSYSSGVYVVPAATSSYAGAHDVMLVGWGVDNGVPYWTAQNSWGPDWGEKGFFRIRRGTNEAGFESTDVDTFTPVPSSDCPNSPCANGSITLADCSCKCTNPLMGGPLCDTLLAQCQNGGLLDQWGTSCVCPSGTFGPQCEYGFVIRDNETAHCYGNGAPIMISYSLPRDPDYRETVVVYSLTNDSPSSSSLLVHLCPAPGPCPRSGSLMLPVSRNLAVDTFRIMTPRLDAASGLFFTLSKTTPLVSYYTVLPAASCTPGSLRDALAKNAPNASVIATLRASLAELGPMKARLDAAAGTRALLLAQTALRVPPLTLDGIALAGGGVYMGTVRQLCYYITPWLNMDKINKQLHLRIGGAPNSYYPMTISLPALDLVANPNAVSPSAGCFNVTFSSAYPSTTMYTLALVAEGLADYAAFPLFNMRKVVINPGTPTKAGATAASVKITWKVDTPTRGDTIRIAAINGKDAAPACVLSTATSLAASGVCIMIIQKVTPTQAPYFISFYPANASRSAYTLASPLLAPNICTLFGI